jgi:hypothetical protein
MARIAEDLLLLLLDNASARPALDDASSGRLLSAAVLLDLAHACRIRPAVDSEPVEAGRLLVLNGPVPVDPVLAAALELLLRRPLSPAAAIAKLRRGVPPAVLWELECSGQIQQVRLQAKGLTRPRAWPLIDRSRVTGIRAAMMATLFDDNRPDPVTASIITLLYTVDGLGAVLSLNDRGWEWVLGRAGDVASGSWVGDAEPELPEVNLAVTTAAVRQALKPVGRAAS